MLHLKSISRKGDLVVCQAFVEDCKEAVHLRYDLESGVFSPYTLPEKYDWCDTYIQKAGIFFETNQDALPEERFFYWC